MQNTKKADFVGWRADMPRLHPEHDAEAHDYHIRFLQAFEKNWRHKRATELVRSRAARMSMPTTRS